MQQLRDDSYRTGSAPTRQQCEQPTESNSENNGYQQLEGPVFGHFMPHYFAYIIA
jgi:hypothetical protein